MREYPLQQILDDIAHAVAPEQFDAAAMQAVAALDVLNIEVIGELGVALACREGCSLCCSLRVDVFAHEVFLLARHIRARFTAGEFSDLLVRLAAHADLVLPLSTFEHATMNVPCPLLQDGRCTVYAARPHSCRRHHSQDFAVCQFTYDHPTDLESPAAHDRELFRALTEAMQLNIDAYAELGYDYTIYQLGTALHEALTDPASWERWLNHEQAFLRASITPAS
jgi:hypothetical protein